MDFDGEATGVTLALAGRLTLLPSVSATINELIYLKGHVSFVIWKKKNAGPSQLRPCEYHHKQTLITYGYVSVCMCVCVCAYELEFIEFPLLCITL